MTSICSTSSRSITCTRRSRCRDRHNSPPRIESRGGLELVQQLLEPQLVRLMHGDEQQLVVGRRIRLRHLLVEQIGQPQVAAVGEDAAFLTKAPARPGQYPSPMSVLLPGLAAHFGCASLRRAEISKHLGIGERIRVGGSRDRCAEETLRTGTSSFLPDRVRGMPGT